MTQWFVQIENRDNHIKFTVYENGLVYGPEKDQKLYILKEEVIEQIKQIITTEAHQVKGQVGDYFNYKKNNLLLRININTRKYKIMKLVGWNKTEDIFAMIRDPNNHSKEFIV